MTMARSPLGYKAEWVAAHDYGTTVMRGILHSALYADGGPPSWPQQSAFQCHLHLYQRAKLAWSGYLIIQVRDTST